MNSKSTAHVELFAGCLRVFGQGKKYGDEYVFSCSLHWVGIDEVEVKGVSTLRHSPLAYREAIGEALKRHGIKVIRWSRKTTDGDQLIRIDVETGKLIRKEE